jgi:hypothetical protein
MDLLHLVDRLEELVAEAQKMPIGNRVIIDRRRLLDLVDQMRVSVPQEVRDAQEMVGDRDRIRRETEEESRLIIARAEEQVTRLVNDHELTEAARARAREISQEAELRLEDRVRQANEDIQHRIEESRHLARQQMQAADEYARELLMRLDRQLQAFVGSVQSGIAQLEPERELPPPPVPGEFDPGPVEPGSFDSDGAMGSLPEDEVEAMGDTALSARETPEQAAQPAPEAAELEETAAELEAMARPAPEREMPPPMTSAPMERSTADTEPSTPRDVRSGFGDPAPASSAAPGELEDLLGRARATAETAALDAAIETELALDEDEEVIDDFAHPPLDDDPLLADELAAERVAEERASRGNGDH